MPVSSNPSLLKELCRLFHAKPDAMTCALRHGQVTVDGYIMRPEFDRRWTRRQLVGRYAEVAGRQARLFDGIARSD